MTQAATMPSGGNYPYGYPYHYGYPYDPAQHYYPASMQVADSQQQQLYEMYNPQYLQQYWTEQMYDHSLFHRWFDYKNDQWVKGAVVGAAAAVLLTNSTVQKTLAKGVIGLWGTLQSGVEEFKEQIRDIQAENSEKCE